MTVGMKTKLHGRLADLMEDKKWENLDVMGIGKKMIFTVVHVVT